MKHDMNGHFIKRCKHCNTVIAQCRCTNQGKSVDYGTCDTCKKKFPESISKFACGLQLEDEDDL